MYMLEHLNANKFLKALLTQRSRGGSAATDPEDRLVIFLILWLGLTTAPCVAKTYEPSYHKET